MSQNGGYENTLRLLFYCGDAVGKIFFILCVVLLPSSVFAAVMNFGNGSTVYVSNNTGQAKSLTMDGHVMDLAARTAFAFYAEGSHDVTMEVGIDYYIAVDPSQRIVQVISQSTASYEATINNFANNPIFEVMQMDNVLIMFGALCAVVFIAGLKTVR